MGSRGGTEALMTALMLGIVIMLCGSGQRLYSQVQTSDLYGPYLGQESPGPAPRVFAPEGLRSTAEWLRQFGDNKAQPRKLTR